MLERVAAVVQLMTRALQGKKHQGKKIIVLYCMVESKNYGIEN